MGEGGGERGEADSLLRRFFSRGSFFFPCEGDGETNGA